MQRRSGAVDPSIPIVSIMDALSAYASDDNSSSRSSRDEDLVPPNHTVREPEGTFDPADSSDAGGQKRRAGDDDETIHSPVFLLPAPPTSDSRSNSSSSACSSMMHWPRDFLSSKQQQQQLQQQSSSAWHGRDAAGNSQRFLTRLSERIQTQITTGTTTTTTVMNSKPPPPNSNYADWLRLQHDFSNPGAATADFDNAVLMDPSSCPMSAPTAVVSTTTQNPASSASSHPCTDGSGGGWASWETMDVLMTLEEKARMRNQN